jgi:hypothetical protein
VDADASGLLAPYISAQHALDIQHGPDPAAGAAFSFDYPQNRVVVPLSLTFKFVTDANVANRTVRIEYDDGRGTPFYREVMGAVQAAATTAFYSAAVNRGAADLDTNDFAALPLLAVPLVIGQALQINVTNIQAGDQISQVVMLFARLPLDES